MGRCFALLGAIGSLCMGSGVAAARAAEPILPASLAVPPAISQAAGTPLQPTVVRECGGLPTRRWAPAEAFTAMWKRSGRGWTGGDGTYSVALPGHRVAWVFGDTFLGGVEGGRRTDDGMFARNSLVIQDRRCITVRIGRVAGQPAGFAEPGVGFYWPNQPFVEAGMLHIPFTKFVRTGEGQWDFTHAGETDLLSYDLEHFALRGERSLPGGVQWGTDTQDAGRFSYVFGVANDGLSVRVARAPRGRITQQPWEFWDGARWVPEAGASAPILGDVSVQMSVVKVGRRWVAVTQGREWDHSVYAAVARRPQGPYGPRQAIATFEPPPNGFTYNAVVHPAFGTQGGHLISTNVNTRHELFLTDPALNQPLFQRVDLAAIAARATVP